MCNQIKMLWFNDWVQKTFVACSTSLCTVCVRDVHITRRYKNQHKIVCLYNIINNSFILSITVKVKSKQIKLFITGDKITFYCIFLEIIMIYNFSSKAPQVFIQKHTKISIHSCQLFPLVSCQSLPVTIATNAPGRSPPHDSVLAY